ncbi:aminodeoxychorismate lyase [Zhongshania aquimaris]|uniref:Aminodeoxychorismate lyase n=1 Tax=Zhongshania aquimaris TaxID=2857107 RepID=A0ABS6VLQ6_9GAMM|nr:aminodeoxychorismate lyase [Zhongshania aquimaris]MBW2939204.1 aminodeoxychorismate lyase [Zhongshania aquimaris]
MAKGADLTLINGQFCKDVSVGNRGLAYGDGLFETILVRDFRPLWLDDHLARLVSGAKQLNIPCDVAELKRDCARLLGDFSEPAAALKIVITRGASMRGYTPHAARPERIVSIAAYTQNRQLWDDGIAVAVCQTQLSSQPKLAGIKHLNRLEQVLAAEEIHRRGFHEGLMTERGLVVEGSRSNLFMVVGGILFTPSLSRCGVDGIMRQRVLKHANALGLETRIKEFGVSALCSAEEAFVCNSVFGIWPISKVECVHMQIGPISRLLQREFDTYFYL